MFTDSVSAFYPILPYTTQNSQTYFVSISQPNINHPQSHKSHTINTSLLKLSFHHFMTSPNKPKPKASRLARMTEKPMWRRRSPKNKSITTNDVGNQPTPPTSYPQGHSFDPNYKPYHFGQTSSFNPSYTTQPPNNYNTPYHFGKSSNHTSNNPYTTPLRPYQTNDSLHIAAEKQKFRNEINQIHDLRDLLAMHLAQRNKGQPPSSPYANCLPHSLNLQQVSNHSHFCPCCIFLQK